MFSITTTKIKIKSISINTHTVNSFYKRNKKAGDIIIPNDAQITLVIQRNINAKRVAIIKGLVELEHNLFALVNVYEAKDGSGLFAKTLTILTKFQVQVSWNLYFGNHLSYGFVADIIDVIEKDIWFDARYEDFLNKIKWDEKEVISCIEPVKDINVKPTKGFKVKGLKGSYKLTEKINGKDFYVYG